MLKVSFNIGNYPYSLAQSSEKCNDNLRKISFITERNCSNDDIEKTLLYQQQESLIL